MGLRINSYDLKLVNLFSNHQLVKITIRDNMLLSECRPYLIRLLKSQQSKSHNRMHYALFGENRKTIKNLSANSN